MSDYFDHLDYEDFEQPVVIVLEPVSEKALIPSYDVTELLENSHSVSMSDISVAKAVEPLRAEVAFDGSVVDDEDAVVEELRDFLEDFNEERDWYDGDSWDETWRVEFKINQLD